MPLYVRFFCDKFVESFLPRLIGALYRCRRIGEVGAQQMQVDVGTLKATLLELPTLGQARAHPRPPHTPRAHRCEAARAPSRRRRTRR